MMSGKKNILSLVVFMLSICFLGCQPELESKQRLYGKWTYANDNLDRAEFWFEENQALHIDETIYAIDFYNYSIKQDSLILMDITGSYKITAFNITNLDYGNLNMENNFVKIKLIKFNANACVDTSTICVDKIYAEFKERLLSAKSEGIDMK